MTTAYAPTSGGGRNVHMHGFVAVGANMTRAGVAEMVGAFFLVYTGTATASAAVSGKSIAGAPPNSLSVALAFGLVLAALVGALGPVSGAHLNPAVTLGLATIRKFPWRYVPVYIAFQLVGAVLGALATWATFGKIARDDGKLGLTAPAAGVSEGRALIVEGLITFLLVFVVIAVATDTRVAPAVASTSIGFALTASVLIGGASTGGAVNPVRALGPEIATGTFTAFWVYLVGPIVGGVFAAVLYDQVIRRGQTPTIGEHIGAAPHDPDVTAPSPAEADPAPKPEPEPEPTTDPPVELDTRPVNTAPARGRTVRAKAPAAGASTPPRARRTPRAVREDETP